MKSAFFRFGSASSIFGLPRVFNAEHVFVKVVWLILILISSGFGIKFIVDTFNDFSKFEVITTTRTIETQTITFPAITICKLLDSKIKFKSFHFKSLDEKYETKDYDTFQIYIQPFNSSYGCFRFNAFKNNSEFSDVSLNEATFFIMFETNLLDDFTGFEYRPKLVLYISDHYINSFEKITPIFLKTDVNKNKITVIGNIKSRGSLTSNIYYIVLFLSITFCITGFQYVSAKNSQFHSVLISCVSASL